jgi:hypothetical protein
MSGAQMRGARMLGARMLGARLTFSLATALLALALNACAAGRPAARADAAPELKAGQRAGQRAERKEGRQKMDAIFSRAVDGYTQDFLDAERQLLSAGAAAVPTLRANLNHADPVAQMIARYLIEWIEGRAPEYQEALDYLDYLPDRLARTPITSPPPLGVAAYLKQHFGPRVAEFLAVRLVKIPRAPHWRMMGVLFYLKEQAVAPAVPALIRFAVETQNDEWRAAAVAAIQAANDPQLQARLQAEQQRAAARQLAFPPPLAALLKP